MFKQNAEVLFFALDMSRYITLLLNNSYKKFSSFSLINSFYKYFFSVFLFVKYFFL